MAVLKQMPVVTISRQYGAGGRSVAKGLSEKLGLKYYDVDFIRLTAQISGYSEEEVRREGEDMAKGASFINTFLTNVSFENPYQAIFNAQKAVILGLAEKPCILVGRCSNIILRDAGIPSFDVFLTGSKAYRVEQAAKLAENGDTDLEKYVDRRDHWRRNYYKSFTEHEFGEAGDYHLCLDVSFFGVERCVEIIAELLS